MVIASETVYVGLGSNKGNRKEQVRKAVRKLATLPDMRIVVQSRLYETEPVQGVQGGWFLNGVIKLQTALSPHTLLDRLKTIEREMGRQEKRGNKPRVIDLDILFFGDRVLHEPDLCIPHPEIAKRKFVLVPLYELDPAFEHPVVHKSVKRLLEELDGDDIVKPYNEC